MASYFLIDDNDLVCSAIPTSGDSTGNSDAFLYFKHPEGQKTATQAGTGGARCIKVPDDNGASWTAANDALELDGAFLYIETTGPNSWSKMYERLKEAKAHQHRVAIEAKGGATGPASKPK